MNDAFLTPSERNASFIACRPDPANPVSVGCGNTIGRVETGSVAANLGPPDRSTIVSYIDMCERAIVNRTFYSWPLFLIGGLTIIWLGVVRQRPSPDQVVRIATPSA